MLTYLNLHFLARNSQVSFQRKIESNSFVESETGISLSFFPVKGFKGTVVYRICRPLYLESHFKSRQHLIYERKASISHKVLKGLN